MAEHAGTPLGEDVRFVDVSYHLTDALVRGDADAAFAVFENYELVEAREAGVDARLLRFTDHGVPSYGYLVFCANRRALATEGHRQALGRFVDGVIAGVELTRADPDRALRGFLAHAPQHDTALARKLHAATLERYTTDASLDPAEWHELGAFLARTRPGRPTRRPRRVDPAAEGAGRSFWWASSAG